MFLGCIKLIFLFHASSNLFFFFSVQILSRLSRARFVGVCVFERFLFFFSWNTVLSNHEPVFSTVDFSQPSSLDEKYGEATSSVTGEC